MKKAVLAILWLILSLMLPACATNDGLSKYDRLEAKVRTTEQVAAKARANLDSFERQAEAAGQWFEFKSECKSNSGIWFCPNGGAVATNKRNKPMTTEKLVRDYNKEKFAGCGCTTSGQMREIMRRVF